MTEEAGFADCPPLVVYFKPDDGARVVTFLTVGRLPEEWVVDEYQSASVLPAYAHTASPPLEGAESGCNCAGSVLPQAAAECVERRLVRALIGTRGPCREGHAARAGLPESRAAQTAR
jgi:hypothetical protein